MHTENVAKFGHADSSLTCMQIDSAKPLSFLEWRLKSFRGTAAVFGTLEYNAIV